MNAMAETAEKKDGRRSDLPDRITAHLTDTGPATPYNIGKAIGRSAGAVTVAGRYLTAEGRLEVHTDKPLTFRITGDARELVTPAKPKREASQSTTPSSQKSKAAEWIETLEAHKDLAKAAKESGAPIPSDVLAKTDAAKARKMAEARRTRTAPAAVAAS